MSLSEKAIGEFKEIWQREYGKELTDSEARESAQNLYNFVELIYEFSKKDWQRKQRLKKEPGGFPVDNTYSCIVCGTSINPSNGWYDQGGQKCQPCQRAVKEGVIPTFVCKERESYFLMWRLKSDFGLTRQAVNKYIKQGVLKPRIVTREDGKSYEYIFLRKENSALISRYSPERKSYDRHRKKVNKIWTREKKKEWRKEHSKKKRVAR